MQEPFFTEAIGTALLEQWKSPLYAKERQANPNTPKNKAGGDGPT
jgi:hypothetical protein